jgi:hypothetical protein
MRIVAARNARLEIFGTARAGRRIFKKSCNCPSLGRGSGDARTLSIKRTSRVTVYRWSKYDIGTDTEKTSHRMGTREAVARCRGTVIEDSGVEIDASLLGDEVDAMTSRNFNPNWAAGEQCQARPRVNALRAGAAVLRKAGDEK